MQLFYNPNIDEQTESFSLIRKRANISLKYYVKKDSDILYVTNGHGLLFETEITLASDNKCTVRINVEKKSLQITACI
jgi:16S rRNA (uracil1498-N3)-methyltransferase